MALGLLVDWVWRMRLGNIGEAFCPRQRGTLALRVHGGLVPGIEQMQPRLLLPSLDGLLRVHVQAIGTTVHLRHARLDQREQARFQSAVLKIFLDLAQSCKTLGGSRERVEPLHGKLLCLEGGKLRTL